MEESNFLILFVGCALLRILPDGFELGIGSPIHGINLIKVL